MIEDEDITYINRIKQGDLQAYGFLVDKYKDMAFSLALKLSRSPEDAEDAVQESFIKAYHKIDTFQFNSKFSTWLYRIVYRTAAYNLRKNVIKTEAISEENTNYRHADDLTDLTETERRQFIGAAIDKLPKIEALIITLFYLNENTIEEIKTITGLSKSNIKVKLFRARKKLKVVLKHLLKDEIKSLL